MAEKIGLESIWNNQQFLQGQAQYVQAIQQATQATSKGAQGISQFGLDAANTGFAGMVKFGLGIGIGIAAVEAIISKVYEATTAIIEFGKEAVITAARANEMGLVMQYLGQRAGYSEEFLSKQTEAIKELGIRTDSALGLQIAFARYQWDIAKATDVARVAQDAAVITMSDSSETLDRLIWGIQTYNKRVLRTAGIMVDVDGAFEKYAQQLGKNKDDLTEVEKQQATLNAVLSEGARIAGVYELAMKDPGKQLRSFGRDLYELTIAAGQPFQGAFLNVVLALRGTAKGMLESVSAGGELYPVLVGIGVIAEEITGVLLKVTDGFFGVSRAAEGSAGAVGAAGMGMKTGAQMAAEAADDMRAAWVDRIMALSEDALRWGVNVVTQFAIGLAEGASGALVWAINAISSLVGSMLAPGSPPKALPKLPQWGAAAMTEYLKGFSKADFSALKAIQQPLGQAFSMLVQTGKLSEGAAGKMMVNLSQELAKALSSGVADESLFAKIAKSAGPFGEEIADLARKQFALAQATEKVDKAEKKLDEARKKESKTQAARNSAVSEYNRMLRSGATKEQLQAQMAIVNAREDEADAATEQRAAAEAELATAQEGIEILREQVELQSELVDQLLNLTKAQIQMPDMAAALGGSAGGLGEAGEGLGAAVAGGFTKSINTAFENLKASLREKFFGEGGIFRPLIDAWNEQIAPELVKIQDAWNNLVATFGEAWDQFMSNPLVQAFIDWIKKIIPPDVIENLGKLSGVLLVVGVAVAVVGSIIGFVVGIIGTIIAALFTLPGLLVLLAVLWATFGKRVSTTVKQLQFIVKFYWDKIVKTVRDAGFKIGKGIRDWIDNSLKAIKGWIKDIIDQWTRGKDTIIRKITDIIKGIKEQWERGRDWIVDTVKNTIASVVQQWQNGRDTIKNIFNQIIDNIKAALDNIKAKFDNFKSTVIQPLMQKFTDLKNTAVQAWTDIKNWIATKVAEIQTAWATFKSQHIDPLIAKFNTMKDNIRTAWTDIKTWILAKVDEIKAAWANFKSSHIDPLIDKFNTMRDSIRTAWTDMKNWILTKLGELQTALNNARTGFLNSFQSKWDDIKSAVKSLYDWLQNLINRVLGSSFGQMLLKLLDLLGLINNLGGGRNFSANIHTGGGGSDIGLPLSSGVAQVPITTGVSKVVNVNMVNHVYSGMDAAALESMILRTVRKALATG